MPTIPSLRDRHCTSTFHSYSEKTEHGGKDAQNSATITQSIPPMGVKYIYNRSAPFGWFMLQYSYMTARLPYVWDYDIDAEQFREILAGKQTLGRLDQDWAAQRLLEYAPYKEIIELIGFCRLIENWRRWRPHIRSQTRKRGFDFLVSWLPQAHPELCHDEGSVTGSCIEQKFGL